MEQNSDKWLEWRRQGIGASDAPVIMGVSPWRTPYQLWQDKMGFTKQTGNFATQRGHDLEPKARASFELEINDDFPPVLASHAKLEWLRASLDGFNKDKNAILEIKCPGKDDHETAAGGKIPEKYVPQLQHQLLVTGADLCYYYSFDGEAGVTIEVKPDITYINDELIPRLTEFYEQMKTKTPPALSDRDQVVIDDPEIVILAEQYAKLDDDAKAIKKTMEALKSAIDSKITHPKAKIGRVTYTCYTTKGTIDYKNIPRPDGIDIEEFRKSPSSVVKLLVGKK